ncbi:MAG: hypothetical protein JNL45_11695 [Hyphomicrobium sp.]|nr:hypothetical protein [Hyphomicrobium sp.]
MTVDSVIAPDLLNAEIAAIEDLLVHYEDWRALAQLEARERKGELPANVASSGIKTLLLDKLATNPLFLRRQTLLKEVERLTKQARVEAAVSETDRASEPAEDVDDLTRIRGIDARLERRLNALNIISYAQIAIWEDADVDYFARTLGLDHSIIGEKWIEQAAVLVARQKLAPRKSASSPITRPSVALPQTPRPITTPMDAEAIEDAATPAEPQSQGRQPNRAAASLDPARGGKGPGAEPFQSAIEERQSSPLKGVREGQSAHAASPEPVPLADVAKTGLPSAQSAPEKQPPGKPQSEPTKPQIKPEPEKEAAPAKPDAGDAAPLEREPDYPLATPAMPLPASAYALPFEAYVREIETVAKARANDTAKDTAPIRGPAEIAGAHLKPAGPLPASRYAGAAHEPTRGDTHPSAPLPPKPDVASAYASPAQASDGKGAQGDAGQPQRAGDILERSLPPLPLKPADTASARQRVESAEAKTAPLLQETAPSPRDPSPLKTPPADAASATTAAIAAAQAAVAARSAPPPVKSAPQPQLAPDGAIAATTTGQSAERDLTASAKSLDPMASPPRPTPSPAPGSATAPAVPTEAGLLAAAAARGLAEAAPPPPLPPSTSAQTAPLAQQAARRTIQVEEKPQPALQSAAEARVTIRRTEDVATNAVLRVPGGTDVHLRTPPRDEDKFDGRSYAAYHSEVQEARVEIRRTPPHGAMPVPVRGSGDFSYGGMPPAATGPAALDAATRAAAEAAARAAATLANAQNAAPQQSPAPPAASEPAPPPPPGPPAEEPPKPPVTMGRFLKALTGQ